MRTRRGNLGFGALASGPFSGPQLPPPPSQPDYPFGAKLSAYAILHGGSVRKLSSYGVLDASLYETTVGVTDFRAYGLYINLVPIPVPPAPQPRRARFRLGMAEYSHTTGQDAYLLRGAIPSFETFRSQLRDGERFRYRTVSGVTQEVGEAIFDWPGNRIIRSGPSSPASAVNSTPHVDWGDGRKIIHFVEDDGIRVTSPRLLIGLAEYTNTEGLSPYVLLGALREYHTLASRLGHGQRVKYRATNNAKEEISEGIYDAVNNTLIRNLTIIPAEPINWGRGRKLIYITEIY